MKKFRMHSGHVELAVANLLNYRTHTIVPNVSWGLGLPYECDMLALDRSGRFTEIEIKVTMSDLKADAKKKHFHNGKFISRVVYAIPETMLEKAIGHIPANFGIITVSEFYQHETYTIPTIRAEWYRIPKHNKMIKRPEQNIINDFHRLGCMRIWSLKQHNNNRNFVV